MRWTEEPGGLQSMGSQRLDVPEHTNTHAHTHNHEMVLWGTSLYNSVYHSDIVWNLIQCES